MRHHHPSHRFAGRAVRRSAGLAIGLALGYAFLGQGMPTAAADAGFQVVVNDSVQGEQVPREALSLIFLKKAARWGDGSPASPVDQSLRSEVRSQFSESILGEPIEGIQSIWHKQMVRGLAPPPVKSSDDEVLSFVASTPGAIGYVSAGTPLPNGVRSITVID